MQNLLPQSFTQALAGVFSFFALLAWGFSFKESIRIHSLRLFAILIIGALALFCNNGWVYFAGVFIIATAITETEFLQNLAAIIRGSKHYFEYKLASGEMVAPSRKQISQRQPMEYKILNILWTKQVNKFPDFSKVFTFIISSNSPEYLKFREAGGKLIGEGLISETNEGHYHHTPEGYEYCKQHFKEFPPPQWWPEETINQDNLKLVLKNV